MDTRRLLISLPDDKYRNWTHDIDDIVNRSHRRVTLPEIRSLIGRLQHTASIIPMARHFTNRLYRLQARLEKYRTTRITANERNDLLWWRSLLDHAHHGINMNLLTLRQPSG